MRTLATLLLVVPAAAPAAAQCDAEIVISPEMDGYDWFGSGLALEGNRLGIGAPGAGPGAVYLYERSGGAWVFTDELVDANQTSGASFGTSVAFRGPGELIVGDHRDSSDGVDDLGSVSVFEDTGSGWSLTQRLLPSDLPDLAEFGRVLAVDGNWLAVGATGVNSNQGATYFFEHDGSQWVERQVVVAAPGPVYQGSIQLELEGDLALITVLRESQQYGWGMVHVYELQGGVWTQVQELEAPYPRGSDWVHGQSLAIVGEQIVAGTAPAYASGEDLALVWERGANGFELVQELRPHPGQPATFFGSYVAAAGDRLAVASDDRLHLFARVDGSWVREKDLDLGLDLASVGGWFLDSIHVGAEGVVIAQPHWNGNRGRVHSLAFESNVSTFCPGVTCPCGNLAPSEGCAHSGGGGAWLEACGSTSVGLDDLTLRVANAPVNQFGILFMGAGEQEATLADGRLCVGPGNAGLFRYLPAGSTGAEGTFTVGPGIAGLSQSFELAGRIAPGQTWVFQGWVRDPGGPCGTGSTVSSAVRVTFTP